MPGDQSADHKGDEQGQAGGERWHEGAVATGAVRPPQWRVAKSRLATCRCMAPWRVRASAGLAVRSRPAGGLEPVLAKRGEVDQEVNGVGEALCECLLRIEHRFVS